MNAVNLLLSAAIAYLLGSVNASVLLSKAMFGKDVRESGSGNAGATNMGRTYGKRAGGLTLLCDALKAVAATAIGSALGGAWGLAAAGVFCLLGHCFPLYHGFKGGKGVSVGVMIGFAAGWQIGAAACAGFIIAVALSRRVSLGSIAGCVCAMITAGIVLREPATLGMVLVCAALIIVRHRENIGRLIRGEEKEFRFGHAKKNTEEGKGAKKS